MPSTGGGSIRVHPPQQWDWPGQSRTSIEGQSWSSTAPTRKRFRPKRGTGGDVMCDDV